LEAFSSLIPTGEEAMVFASYDKRTGFRKLQEPVSWPVMRNTQSSMAASLE
jgi:hypothetical protein